MQYAQSEPSTARALERMQAGPTAEQTLAREQLLTMGVSAAPQLLARM
jgi:hypothetical protein